MNQEESDRLTKRVTLAVRMAVLNQFGPSTEPTRVDPSDNAMEGDSAFVFNFKYEGHTFNVEVFGPYAEDEVHEVVKERG